MSDFNPDALVAWLFFASCGYLLAGITGAIAGLALITGLQTVIAVYYSYKTRTRGDRPEAYDE